MAVRFHNMTLSENWYERPNPAVPKSYIPGDTRQNLDQSDRGTVIQRCSVELAPGFEVWAYGLGDDVFIGTSKGEVNEHFFTIEDVAPFIAVERLSDGFHKVVTIDKPVREGYYGAWKTVKVTEQATYVSGWSYSAGRREDIREPWNYLSVRLSCVGAIEVQEMELRWRRPDVGLIELARSPVSAKTLHLRSNFFGLSLEWSDDYHQPNDGYHYEQDPERQWARICRHVKASTVDLGCDALIEWGFDLIGVGTSYDDKQCRAVERRKDIAPNLERLKAEQPLLWRYYAWLHDSKTRDGTSNNALLSAFMQAVGTDYEALTSALRESMMSGQHARRAACLALPGAGDKDKERRSKKEWNLREGLAEQADGLGIKQDRHAKLFEAVREQKIPISIFHEPGKPNVPVNVEFDLWEKALRRDGWAEPIYRIAQDASRRTTYEKNVTPYLSFLFRIEKYLDRNTHLTGTRNGWKAVPKYVESEFELEMAEADENGTVKRRSALTPVADNETRTVTVPYAAMAIHGRQTTYCYALNYYVFEENTIDPESKSPVVYDVEMRLNGRDDYGLMYFTLTGTNRNRGYPTFLIIFERLKRRTRVHFHRVHPCRSKDGVTTPASRLVEECYRYMAGNVRAEEIHAQQGDLIFIKVSKETIEGEAKPVAEFESHKFIPERGHAVRLVENQSKSVKNRLGYLIAEDTFKVDHPEHDPLESMPPGVYEVRRCKSWEANPKAVWSYTID